VTIASVLVVGVALLAGGLVLLATYRASIANDVEAEARLRSRDIADAVRGGDLAADVADSGGDDSVVQVVDPSGAVVASSSNIAGRRRISNLVPEPDRATATTTKHLPVGDSPFRIVLRRAGSDSGNYVVYVARSLETVNAHTDRLARLLAIGYPLLLLLVGATAWVVIGRALRPVEAIRVEVEAIGASDLHRRVPEPPSGDEVGRLAHTMNRMLARLQEASDRHRRFVADASHELRSPLTGIRAQLEVDLAHPERAEWQSTEQDVLEETIRLQRLVDDLLALAATPTGQADEPRRDLVDLDDIVLREARRMRTRSTHLIDTTGVSGAQIEGDADLLSRAVRNLLDNADRHATSAVTVALSEDTDEVVLSVIDDGPGVPAGERGRIFQPFTRLDEARARDTGGAGLGLAIVRESVVAHGGSITIDDVPGAQFTVRLPRHPAPGAMV
jgi:signal transduction histidine kinase